jgi:multidrug efflux pump subunit AcrA (membrane-fusion protein)
VGPQERLDLAVKLAEARYKEKGAEEVQRLRQGVVDRLAKTSSGGIAQRDRDEARVQLAEADTQLASARASVLLWKEALDEIDGRKGKPEGPWVRPLHASVNGASGELEITELLGQPGMAVEAGGLIARIVDFSRPLVRLDLPAELARNGQPPAEVDLITTRSPEMLGGLYREEDASPVTVKAVRVGPAPLVDSTSQFTGYFYRIVFPPSSAGDKTDRPGRSIWRPGLFVQARLPVGAQQEVISVPDEAVLVHLGRTLVYLKIAPDRYERREVQVLGRDGDRALLARPLWSPALINPGDVVVTHHAQALLSVEFRREGDDDD